MLDVDADGRVHTFRNTVGILIGADWDATEVEAAIRTHGCELSGQTASSLGHGLVLRDERGYLFLRTKDRERSGASDER